MPEPSSTMATQPDGSAAFASETGDDSTTCIADVDCVSGRGDLATTGDAAFGTGVGSVGMSHVLSPVCLL